jgi:hypothetical protein
MTLGGTLTTSEVSTSQALQQQLVNSVADTMGVAAILVQLVSYRDARRRLLAVSVIFRILVSGTGEAATLQSKAYTADFTSAMRSNGLDADVSGVMATITTMPSVTLPTSTPASAGSRTLVSGIDRHWNVWLSLGVALMLL